MIKNMNQIIKNSHLNNLPPYKPKKVSVVTHTKTQNSNMELKYIDIKPDTKKQLFYIEFGNDVFDIPYEETKNKTHNFSILKQYLVKNRYRVQFFASIVIASIFILILYFHIRNSNTQEKLSKELLNNYTLTTLYQDRNIDIPEEQKHSVLIENPFVIGMIRISKINLNYPILSESSKDLLKISVCRFAGPMPNETGNLCIAGHNYVDNKFFSRLHELKKEDMIELYDLSGQKLIYSVYDKDEVTPDDLSCTDQNVGDTKILTLLTCNNVNGKRTVIKAKEVVFE